MAVKKEAFALSTARAFDFDRATPDEIAVFLAEAAVAAGPAVMDVYRTGAEICVKNDGSPVTEADRRAEAIVIDHIVHALNAPPTAAEESISGGAPATLADRFLLIDPLDGTREFIARNGEFTINVALVHSGRPIAGAVYAPALARLWLGGDQAFVCEAPVGAGLPDSQNRRKIQVREAPSRLVALASRSHADAQTEAFLQTLPIAERLSRGSSLKFCAIAEGAADVYPRFGPTMEWDTAAGDAVLRAAGGTVLGLSRAPLVYGKFDQGLCNPAFVAWGDVKAAERPRYRLQSVNGHGGQ
jgi:3'(2'),5'-bisphosphate nucleotidase